MQRLMDGVAGLTTLVAKRWKVLASAAGVIAVGTTGTVVALDQAHARQTESVARDSAQVVIEASVDAVDVAMWWCERSARRHAHQFPVALDEDVMAALGGSDAEAAAVLNAQVAEFSPPQVDECVVEPHRVDPGADLVAVQGETLRLNDSLRQDLLAVEADFASRKAEVTEVVVFAQDLGDATQAVVTGTESARGAIDEAESLMGSSLKAYIPSGTVKKIDKALASAQDALEVAADPLDLHGLRALAESLEQETSLLSELVSAAKKDATKVRDAELARREREAKEALKKWQDMMDNAPRLCLPWEVFDNCVYK